MISNCAKMKWKKRQGDAGLPKKPPDKKPKPKSKFELLKSNMEKELDLKIIITKIYCFERNIEMMKKNFRLTLDNFNTLATEAQEADDDFYEMRGVKIHSLEVTAYRCQDASTARILEAIIQETTNRMNRLSQQESEVSILGLKL